MHLRYALMALLSEGEAHGYQLLKLFAQRIGPFWHPNIGQVYQLLHDLERRGLVERRDNEAGSRLRRIFRLTTRGERALRTWLTRRPAWPPPLRDEIFVRLLAAERGGTSALLAQVERQEVEYRRYLALVRQAAAAPRASLSRQLTDEAAVVQAEAHLGWLSRCRTLLSRPETVSRGGFGSESVAFGKSSDRHAGAGEAGAANGVRPGD
jgi:DNA-binding PadR family transcriptional regulator